MMRMTLMYQMDEHDESRQGGRMIDTRLSIGMWRLGGLRGMLARAAPQPCARPRPCSHRGCERRTY